LPPGGCCWGWTRPYRWTNPLHSLQHQPLVLTHPQQVKVQWQAGQIMFSSFILNSKLAAVLSGPVVWTMLSERCVISFVNFFVRWPHRNLH
jgi:hypothetical protein